MIDAYGKDLDLNLLRVFVVVAETGSVTEAASRLYLTQPAVSAALRRLSTALSASLFTRQGRGLALNARGTQLLLAVKPHLRALVDASLAPSSFDPSTSDRILRLGLSDTAEAWLLPPLLRVLIERAPGIRIVSLPVQFRTVADALASQRVDLAVTVADELPKSVRRQALFFGGYVCLYDPRHGALSRAVSERVYFSREHVIVSYNGDLRGVVEDVLQKHRRVRCSVSSFQSLGAIVDGSALLATLPEIVAREILIARPHLRTAKLPFELDGSPPELLWNATGDDDGANRFVRELVVRIARERMARNDRRKRAL